MQTRIPFLILCMLHATYAAPQLISFKDGKVGVNFGGYHAEAGLGGLLTGNPAHGGLSASAGTPWGPQAAAGLNGHVNGRAAGFGYAGAQANPSVGAGAVLGGSTDEGGFLGADAYANGKSTSKSISGSFPSADSYQVPSLISPNDEILPTNSGNNVQKIKPPKKYSLFNAELPNQIAEGETAVNSNNQQPTTNLQPNDKKLSSITTTKIISTRTYATEPVTTVHKTANVANGDDGSVIIVEKQSQRGRKHQRRRVTKTRQRVIVQEIPDVVHVKLETTERPQNNVVHSKTLVKTVNTAVQPEPILEPLPPAHKESRLTVSCCQPGIINSALNIPIGILRSLQDSLSGLHVSKSVSVNK